MFDSPYYDIAFFIVTPTVIADLAVPFGMLLFILTLKNAGVSPPPNFQSIIKRIAVAWVLSLTWRLGYIDFIHQRLSQFSFWQDFYLPPLLHQLLLINTTILHFYVILSLLSLLCRFWWNPSIPYLTSRAYPVLTAAIALTFIVALYLRYAISPPNRDYFAPPWYFYYTAALFVVVAAIQRLWNIKDVTTKNFLYALDPASSKFVLTRFWSAFVAKAKLTARYFTQTRDSSGDNQPIVPDSSRDLFTPSKEPTQTAYIRLRRSQRSTKFAGTILFALDARMEVTAEQRSLITKYRLDDALVYDSADRQRYTESANAHLESTRDNPSLSASPKDQLLGVGKTLYRLGRASVSAARAGLSLRVTIWSLLAGVHVECKSMQELLEAENAIVSAAQNLKSYLETATTFDGREEIIEL